MLIDARPGSLSPQAIVVVGFAAKRGGRRSARQQLDSESRRRMLDPMFAPPVAPSRLHRPDALERALAPGTPRVEQLAGGVVRVTAVNGRQYCLQPMLEVATRGLPEAPVSVPMNCP